MENKIIKVIEVLTNKNKTLSSMESCTGGLFVNCITNIEGSSNILKFSAVTYSNEFKIKMGVDEKVISKFSVYSIETAMEMSYNISSFADSNYGIGVTGKLNRYDENNPCGIDNQVFVSIYDRDNDKYYNFDLFVDGDTRIYNKNIVVNKIIDKLLEII